MEGNEQNTGDVQRAKMDPTGGSRPDPQASTSTPASTPGVAPIPATPQTPSPAPIKRGVFYKTRRFWVIVAALVALVALAVTCWNYALVPDVVGEPMDDAMNTIWAVSDTWNTRIGSTERDGSTPLSVLARLEYDTEQSFDNLRVIGTDPAPGSLVPRRGDTQVIGLLMDGATFDEIEAQRQADIRHEVNASIESGYTDETYDDQGWYVLFQVKPGITSADGEGVYLFDPSDVVNKFQGTYQQLTVDTGSSVIACFYTDDGRMVGIVVAIHRGAYDDERQLVVKRAQDACHDADEYARAHSDEYLNAFIANWTDEQHSATGGDWLWVDDDNVTIYLNTSYTDPYWTGGAQQVDEIKKYLQAQTQWSALMLRANVTVKCVDGDGETWDEYSADCPAWPDITTTDGTAS